MRNISKQQQKHWYIDEGLQSFSIFLNFVLLSFISQYSYGVIFFYLLIWNTMYMFMYIWKYNTCIIYIYIFRYLNVLKKLQHSPGQFVATTHAWNYKNLKFCLLSLLSLVARTRPVGTLSAISINFAKG